MPRQRISLSDDPRTANEKRQVKTWTPARAPWRQGQERPLNVDLWSLLEGDMPPVMELPVARQPLADELPISLVPQATARKIRPIAGGRAAECPEYLVNKGSSPVLVLTNEPPTVRAKAGLRAWAQAPSPHDDRARAYLRLTSYRYDLTVAFVPPELSVVIPDLTTPSAGGELLSAAWQRAYIRKQLLAADPFLLPRVTLRPHPPQSTSDLLLLP